MNLSRVKRSVIWLSLGLMLVWSLLACNGEGFLQESTGTDADSTAYVLGGETDSTPVSEGSVEEDTTESDSQGGKGSVEEGTTEGDRTTAENETTAPEDVTVEGETTEEDTTEEEITREDLFGLDIPEGEYSLTFENLNVLGSDHNVVVFVIDRFDWEYYEGARGIVPEIFYNLDNGGFTYFNDSISLYPRTFPSIAYMVTGVENDFSMSRNDYFEAAYGRSEFMRALYNAGYDINIYTDSYYGYSNAAFMANYAQNAKNNREGYGACSTDMKQIYSRITDNGMTVGEGKKSYKLIHLSGTHLPLAYDENFNPLPSGDPKRSNPTIGLRMSFAIINHYIDEMKRLGVYENSTIIITGDHPSIGSDSAVPLRWAHVTPLFVKPSSRSSGELRISEAPVTHEDLFATVLKSEGFGNYASFGRSVFDIPETEKRDRLYYFQKQDTVDGVMNYEMVTFRIRGKAADYANWEIIDRHYIGGSIYK